MRNLPSLLLLTIVFIGGGCRRYEAEKKPPRKTSSWTGPARPPREDEPLRIPEKVEVTIEEVEELKEEIVRLGKMEPPDQAVEERSPRGQGESLILLALKVRVTSHYQNMKLLVGPQLFYLETERGLKILPRHNGEKKPPLTRVYLKGSSSTIGWLIFSVPWDAEELTLKSCMHQPPLEVPVLWSRR